MHSKKGAIINQLFSSLQYAIITAVTVLFLNIPCMAAPGFTGEGINSVQDAVRHTVKAKEKASDAETKNPLSFIDGQLTVNISDVTLVQLMDEIAAVTGVHVDWQNNLSSNADKLMSVGFSGLPIDEAMKNILQGESYLLFYESGDQNGLLSRVLILPGSDGTQVQGGRSRADHVRESQFMPPQPPHVYIEPEQFAMGMSDVEREMMERDLEMLSEMEEAEYAEHMRNMPPGFTEEW